MTTFNGLVGIVFHVRAIVVSTTLSSQQAVLIHQFETAHEFTNLSPIVRVTINTGTALSHRSRGAKVDYSIRLAWRTSYSAAASAIVQINRLVENRVVRRFDFQIEPIIWQEVDIHHAGLQAVEVIRETK